ncbi:MAG: A/G-specific adenine glycosylase [Eubacteriales bacterium]|nr:A/G-specific adenine glycosylase [Eubacteriales bacterium]
MTREWKDLAALAQLLPAWYDEQARDLPWRVDPNPYSVWISEIMLQQTRVEAVIPYYIRFLRRLPDIAALAQIPDDELMKLWQGLGYYSRARNLKRAAQIICRDHFGEFPGEYDAIRALPGIGDYTAGAVASIAFGQTRAAVDGNALRVFSRLLADGQDISAPAAKKLYARGIAEVMNPDRPGDFNQAVMDIGATVCLPNGAPRCGQCPMNGLCRAYALGIQADLPVKAAKKPRRQEELTVFLLRGSAGEVLLRRRGSSGLLAGLWEFPHVPGLLDAKQAERELTRWGLKAHKLIQLPQQRHVFTHIQWEMAGVEGRVCTQTPLPEGWLWCSPQELAQERPIASAFGFYARRATQDQEEICQKKA